jgi:hypothetical protein
VNRAGNRDRLASKIRNVNSYVGFVDIAFQLLTQLVIEGFGGKPRGVNLAHQRKIDVAGAAHPPVLGDVVGFQAGDGKRILRPDNVVG